MDWLLVLALAGKLVDAVGAWTTEAEALGVLEAQKAALLRQESEGEGVRKSDVQRARNQWEPGEVGSPLSGRDAAAHPIVMPLKPA